MLLDSGLKSVGPVFLSGIQRQAFYQHNRFLLCFLSPLSCRRRLPSVMLKLRMAQNLKTAITFIEQGRILPNPLQQITLVSADQFRVKSEDTSPLTLCWGASLFNLL